MVNKIKKQPRKESKKKFYVTTAIDYPNSEPHCGHAYQKIIADVLARWHKLLGEDVFFLTGTDEHGKKIQEAAEKAGKKPKEFVDELAEKFKAAWKALNVDYNRFIRTTDADHEKLVQDVIKKCEKNGDVYLGKYEGLYCVGCEAYYTEKDAPEGVCPLHNRSLEKIEEESYFFKLSKYQKFLLDLYKKNPEFTLPDERRNEIINRVKEGLKNLSISRTSFKWGIPFPLNKKHIVYCWFDALFNYVSGAGKNQEYWPANVHLLGKDNSWFHCVYWPAFLKSAGYKLPKTVFVHGFLSFNGQKISKSLGNAISPIILVNKYGADSIRYFICRNFAFAEGNDGDFSEEKLVERHNSELADKLGNLVSRVTSLAEKYGVEKCENKILKKLKIKQIEKEFENFEIDKALEDVFAFIDVCNEYVQTKKPWEASCKEREKVIYELVDSIKAIAILLWPFIPSSSEKIAKHFGFEIKYENIEKCLEYKNIKKSEILFSKIEIDKLKGNVEKKEGKQVETKNSEKIELKAATIINIEDIAGADKLYKLEVDLGYEKRIICAGIKQYYSKEELIGKQIIIVANLEPRIMKGIESKGMLLAASDDEHKKVVLIKPKIHVGNGSVVEFKHEVYKK
jgi:methionyl-tRNA synthetase